jgi:hypothetical protein
LSFASGAFAKETGLADRRATHGWLMAIALGVLMPIGVFLPRFKTVLFPKKHAALDGEPVKPSKLWFQLHVSLMTIGFIMGCVGIVVAYNITEDVDREHFKADRAHTLLGLLVFIGRFTHGCRLCQS